MSRNRQLMPAYKLITEVLGDPAGPLIDALGAMAWQLDENDRLVSLIDAFGLDPSGLSRPGLLDGERT